MQTIEVSPNSVFLLERDVCLEATIGVRAYLPAAILKAGERIEDVLCLSDDEIEIGLKESKQYPGKVSTFIIFLKPKDRIKLSRSSEVIFDSDERDQSIVFNVMPEDGCR